MEILHADFKRCQPKVLSKRRQYMHERFGKVEKVKFWKGDVVVRCLSLVFLHTSLFNHTLHNSDNNLIRIGCCIAAPCSLFYNSPPIQVCSESTLLLQLQLTNQWNSIDHHRRSHTISLILAPTYDFLLTLKKINYDIRCLHVPGFKLLYLVTFESKLQTMRR